MNDLKSNLNKLGKIKPTAEWKKKQWDSLLTDISSDQVFEFNYFQKASFLFFHPAIFRPVGNFLAAILVFAVGSWAAIASVQNSMPNHFLYPAKVTLEKMEVALTVDDKAKVSKQTDLARKRVGELQYLVAVAESPITSLHVDKTVENIKQNLQSAHKNLARLSLNAENGNFYKTVEDVEKSAGQISRDLKETSVKLPAEVELSVSRELAETAEQVSDIGAQAFDLLIKDWLVNDQIPEQQLVNKLNEKISELKLDWQLLDVNKWLDVNSADISKDLLLAVEEADQKIFNNFSALDDLLEQKDYVGVLNSIENIRQEIKNLDKVLQGKAVLGEEEVVGEEADSAASQSDVPVVSETSTEDINITVIK